MLPRFGNNGPEFTFKNVGALTQSIAVPIVAAALASDVGGPTTLNLGDEPFIGILNTTVVVQAAAPGTLTVTYWAILPDTTEVQIGGPVEIPTTASAVTLQGFAACQIVTVPGGEFDFQIRAAATTANVTALTVVPTLQVFSQKAA